MADAEAEGDFGVGGVLLDLEEDAPLARGVELEGDDVEAGGDASMQVYTP